MKRALVVAIVAASILLAGPAATAQVHTEGVVSVGFTVRDMDREVQFFTGVLGFEKVGEHEQTLGKKVLKHDVEVRLGDEVLELDQYPSAEGRVFPADARPNDRSFQHVAIIVRDMDAAYARLRAAGVRHASSYPQTLPESIKGAAGIKAFYFRDPEGHFLEILQFPPDKGAAKWHRAGEDLFMGIDHTAIVVGDTETSLRFYRDELGMRVAGESENFGTEQEHLNGVFGAHLRITALRGETGPGIELLEYLAPTDGRAYPNDVRREDLLHWETRIQADSPIANETRDPDGHVIIFMDKANTARVQR